MTRDKITQGNMSKGAANSTKELQGGVTFKGMIQTLTAEEVRIEEPSILFILNRLYRSDMNEEEIYEATRGIWRLGPRREKAAYALAVFKGIVIRVFAIEEWHPAGTSVYKTRVIDPRRACGRWEFNGHIEPALSEKYEGKSVRMHLIPISQSPCRYVNC